MSKESIKRIKKLLEEEPKPGPKTPCIKRYSFVKVLGWWCRILHCNNKSSKNIVESAAFNWETREIIVNMDYCMSQSMYVEILRHEIFEMICVVLKKRYDPPDNRDNCIVLLHHKDIDIVLHEYHAAIDTVR